MASSEFTKGRAIFDCFLVFLTAFVTWFVTYQQTQNQQQLWFEQQRYTAADKLHDTRLQYLQRITKELSEHRSASVAWFFDYLYNHAGYTVDGYDGKHAAYHATDSALSSSLKVLPFFFGVPTQEAIQALETYRADMPWEAMIQNADFIERAKSIMSSKGEGNITDYVSLQIKIAKFDHLSHELQSCMADEIARSMEWSPVLDP